MSGVAAIVLAAGQGTRFGAGPKLLALWNGRPLIRHVVEAALASSADPVVVVTGHRAPDVEAALEGAPVRPVRNSSFASGLSGSLKVGFEALPAEAGGVVVLLGDMPRVTGSLIDELIFAWRQKGKPAALIPTWNGQRGNPVVLSRQLDEQIRKLVGDKGMSSVLRDHAGVLEWPVRDEAVLQDVDTPDALKDMPGS